MVAGAVDWGLMLARGAILVLAIALVAQYAVIVAETSRLPMVAAWDHLIPAWFTRLHPRYRTPTRSILVIVIVSVMLCFLASAGAGAEEAFQIITVSGNICYAIYYLLMFAVPLVAGTRFGKRPGVVLIVGCVCGIGVTLLSVGFSLIPVVKVDHQWVFSTKIVVAAGVANLLGAGIYWRGSRVEQRRALFQG